MAIAHLTRISDTTVLLLIISSIFILFHHTDAVVGTNGGKVYLLGFFNFTTDASQLVSQEIHISCHKCDTTVKIEIPTLNYWKLITFNSNVANNWSYTIDIVKDIATEIKFPVGLVWKNAAVLVSSLNASITVQVCKALPGTIAAYLAFPIGIHNYAFENPLDVIYEYPLAQYTLVEGSRSAVAVSALYNDTCVSIISYRPDGESIKQIKVQSFTLQSGDVFSMYGQDLYEDYTGLVVSTRKPVAVHAGNLEVEIPISTGKGDAIMEQMLRGGSTSRGSDLRRNHIIISPAGRPYGVGFLVRIVIASTLAESFAVIEEFEYDSTYTNPTSVNVVTRANITKFDFYEYKAGVNNTGNKFILVTVRCNTNCLVVQYGYGDLAQRANPSDNLYPDPSMVIVPAVDRYTEHLTFGTCKVFDGSNPVDAKSFIMIIADSISYKQLLLDGQPIDVTKTEQGKWVKVTEPGGLDYYTISSQLDAGFHSLTTEKPSASHNYTAFIYGYGTDPTLPAGCAYLAGYLHREDVFDPAVDGPWYNMTDPAAVVNPPEQTTAASNNSGGGSGSNNGGSSEPRPNYGILFIANFTAVLASFQGKVPERDCAKAYGEYFVYRINKLDSYFENDAEFATAVPGCAVSGLTVKASVGPLADGDNSSYSSEYSRSAGVFTVVITGSGSATLGDINTCATFLVPWIQDPSNWIDDYVDIKNVDRFLIKTNKDFPEYPRLARCSSLYLSNSNGLLTVHKRDWVCPVSATSVFASESTRCVYSATTQIIAFLMLAIGFFVR